MWSGYSAARSPDVQRFPTSSNVALRPLRSTGADVWPLHIVAIAARTSASSFPSREAASFKDPATRSSATFAARSFTARPARSSPRSSAAASVVHVARRKLRRFLVAIVIAA
jgi:hypothetical protein